MARGRAEVAARVRVLCQLADLALAVHRLERLQRMPVQPDAAGGRQPLVDRVPDEDVSEAQAPGLAGHVGDDARGHRLVEHVQEVVDRDAAHAGEGVEREVAAQDRREHEHPVAVGREVGEPAGDHVAHGLGDGESNGLRLATFDREQPHDLAHEQRVALRLGVQRRNELRRRDRPRRAHDVVGDVALAQPSERDAPRTGLPRDGGDQLGQRGAGDRVDVPVGTDDQRVHRAQLARHEPQQQQRRRIGRVQVVQDEHERPALGGPAQELGGRVEHAEARSLRLRLR
jgi:hypothetical protein